ncbi:hypothetical protein [Microbacterium mangrovi]|uniref:hypothetical protein n=1 Tax=Microbacterium mangrovi TaxID=1348253 RepID=UPI0012E08F24|nr:hypothetical protein [Microbacterium mangrovi]
MSTMNTYSAAHLVTLLFAIAVIAALIWVVVKSVRMKRPRRYDGRGFDRPDHEADLE